MYTRIDCHITLDKSEQRKISVTPQKRAAAFFAVADCFTEIGKQTKNQRKEKKK